DYELGKAVGLPVICPINDDGVIIEGFGTLTGKKTTDVADEIAQLLGSNGRLYKTEMYTHSYPKCWRCKTPVVFKLVDEWYIKCDEIRPLMIEAAETVNWEPEFAGKRMIDWLTNMGDWNISRKRFYGLPLPFYPCKKCGHVNIIGSKEELLERSVSGNLKGVPHLHRPYIDKIKIKCEKCGSETERITEVGDCWLDAGIAPFSTKKYFEDKEYFKKNFPSDLVIEMKEQLRLWFYSILFMSVTLEGVSPYRNVLAHSSVINEEGGKFSKTGYMIKFDEAAEEMGADPIRYLFSAAPVAGDVRFGPKLSEDARRKLLGLWNIYSFYTLYATLDNPDIASYKIDYNNLHITDSWLLARTDDFIRFAEKCYSTYKASAIVKEFESFVDDVSNWYIRINRKRFWKAIDKKDQYDAYWCLYRAIKVILGIMAPIIPFMTEHIWQNAICGTEKDEAISVHLSEFPKVLDGFKASDKIISGTEVAREIITSVQNMRNKTLMKIKQPLRVLYIAPTTAFDKDFENNFAKIIKDELNVKNVEFTDEYSKFLDLNFTVNFKVAGAALKGEAQKLKVPVESMTPEECALFDKQLQASGTIDFAGFKNLKAEMFDKHLVAKENISLLKDKNYTLALDLELDDQLLTEGFVRELIRQIQVLRKETGFAVEQRIRVDISTDSAFANCAITEFAEKICQDILAVNIEELGECDAEAVYVIQNAQITVKLIGYKLD
ncbi:MAG: class I tRNA ligase family protein, partial [Christensenellaceae bacterium]|nr:class I tRNA ligase family protein [Christensenellaceae bacterium]